MMTKIPSLEERVRRLEDVMEIRHLKAAYCSAVDGGWDRKSHDGERLAELFVDECEFEVAGITKAVGRPEIARAINGLSGFPFAFHRLSNEVINVDGDHASGQWHLVVRLTNASGVPFWAGGIYRDILIRTDAGWKFKSVFCESVFFGPLAENWSSGWRFDK